MNDFGRPRLASVWLVVGCACLLALAGCQDGRRVSVPAGRVFAVDLAGGAKKCQAPAPTLADGQTVEAAMQVGNDGGWCGLTVTQKSSKPYDSGLLTTRPTHGRVVIKRVGDTTRIDYTPEAAYAGPDSFAVRLIPGDAIVKLSVTVTPP